MIPFLSYFDHTSLSKFFFLVSLLLFPATGLPDSATTNTWHGLMRFLDAGKGSHVDGMAELKGYFRRFGYLPDPSPPPENTNFTDIFDEQFETALISYQKNLGLPVTGKLDYNTMRVVVSPRCGVSDITTASGQQLKTTRRFAYFHGKPRWVRRRSTPMTLSYAFSQANVIGYVSPSDLKAVFRRAFSRWSAVIPVNFAEAEDYSLADIRIGWYHGDHGDGEAFDGVLGVLAHAFSPENGRFHLDAAERWAVDFTEEKSKEAVDLESVATHEIGHVLGLAHSSAKDAVMYPSLSPRTKKVELRKDDVEGIQALYGSNPDYRYNSRLESDLSSGRGMMDLETRKGLIKCWSAAMVILACFFSLGL
ncbi:metalloendoproteinase 1 [Phtheirospermum japonicum]|uniref:Metalloendoproteinase 1 n=1 Tax=Phtheirospermum japonicum TaxID=374723 RepID=A0A830C7I4_9LAMI|nr:metalloendoproteinase 1 [Phtheirospermum japonicum]